MRKRKVSGVFVSFPKIQIFFFMINQKNWPILNEIIDTQVYEYVGMTKALAV